MKRIAQAVFAAAIALVVCGVAQGFNSLGHSVIAKIAYDKLTPAQRTTIHNILKKHPHYTEYLIADKPDDVTRREWSFIRAATWSDWVRSHHREDYHKSEWHYINYPYTMGQATDTLPAALPQSHSIRDRIPAAITMIENSATTNDLGLLTELTNDQRRAVAMTWLFHLTGDYQQPLHVVAMVQEPRWPAAGHGDQGGNKVAIRTSATASKPKKLHSYWDGVLGSNDDYEEITDVADEITTDPSLSATELAALASETDLDAWALEGYKLAGKYCYLDGTLVLSPWLESYDEGGDAADDVPTLPSAVKNNAKRIYRQQLLVGGERLAHRLKLLFP